MTGRTMRESHDQGDADARERAERATAALRPIADRARAQLIDALTAATRARPDHWLPRAMLAEVTGLRSSETGRAAKRAHAHRRTPVGRSEAAERRAGVGRALAQAREAAGLSPSELAERAGVHRSTVAHAEAGTRRLTAATVWALALALRGGDQDAARELAEHLIGLSAPPGRAHRIARASTALRRSDTARRRATGSHGG